MSATSLGTLRGPAPGATLILVGALHGNEREGSQAIKRVLGELTAAGGVPRGEVVGFVGNPAALATRQRFLARDLNRQWTPEKLAAARAAVRAQDAGADIEVRALAALADALDAVITRARGPVYALDLHTTSAEGAPFAIVGGTPADRAFAARLPLTGVVGLQETITGVLSEYLSSRGVPALAIEGGQLGSPEAAAHLDGIVRLALVGTEICDPGTVAGEAEARALLERAQGDLPQLVEVVLRHPVPPTGTFQMVPGFPNIHRTAAGTLLAYENKVEIHAPFDGVLILPLYQAKGEDGFFYGRQSEG